MRLDIIAALVGVAALAFVGLYIYREGRDRTLDIINEQNTEATHAAIEAARDWRSCRDAGGVWDFGAGDCTRAE